MLAALVTVFTVLVVASPAAAVPGPGNELTHSRTATEPYYSRVIQLANGQLLAAHDATYGARSLNNTKIEFYRSTDNGASFTHIGTYQDGGTQAPAGQYDWSTGGFDILEVSPGNVLLSYTRMDFRNLQRGQELKFVNSTNGGASWGASRTVESGVWKWEPELYRSSDGKLQVVYAHSSSLDSGSQADQVIVRRESSDNGQTWGSRADVIGTRQGPAGEDLGNNYGMPRVTKAGSTYVMAVENYDQGYAQVWTFTSTDGKSFNEAGGKAMKIDYQGWMFSAPEITSVNGTLYAIGMRYLDWWNWWWLGMNPRSGEVYFKSTDLGTTWTEVALPLKIGYVSNESNWSSTLLPLASSNEMLFMTSSHANGEAQMTVRWAKQTTP